MKLYMLHATERVLGSISKKLCSVPLLTQPLNEAINTPAQSANVLKPE